MEPCESWLPFSPLVPSTAAAVRELWGLPSVQEVSSSPEFVDDDDAAEVADPATASGATVVASTICEPFVDPSRMVATRMDASGSISTVPLTICPNGFAVARWGRDDIVETECPNMMLKITSTSALKRQLGEGQKVRNMFSGV